MLTVALLGAAAALPPRGVAQVAVSVRIDSIDVSAFPNLRATVTVTDAAGRPVPDLTAQAFQASVNNQPLPVSSVAAASDQGLGIAVLLAFDVSGSMQGAALAQAQEAGKALLNELGPNDQMAVLAFANDVRLIQPFTQDRQALTAAIDSLVAVGTTALYGGVVSSVQTTQTSNLPRRAVVLLSDGEDFGGVSQTDRATSLATAGAADVPFFVVGLGDFIDQRYLGELATVTRGQFSLAPAPEALRGLYQTIGAVLRQQYLVAIDGAALTAGAKPMLRLQVNQAGGTASGEALLNLPKPPVTASPARGPQAPTVTPQTAKEGGSKLLLVLLGLAAVVGVTLAGGTLLWQQRRLGEELPEGRFHSPTRRGTETPIFPSKSPAVEAGEAEAWLELVSSSGDEAYPIGEAPVEIGFTTDCAICLPAGATHGWERARVWRREGRYMLHNLSRMGSVTVGGQPAIWIVLEDGDEIQIGSCKLRFRERDRT